MQGLGYRCSETVFPVFNRLSVYHKPVSVQIQTRLERYWMQSKPQIANMIFIAKRRSLSIIRFPLTICTKMLYTNHYNTVVISSCISISYAGLAILLPLFYPANAPDNGMILFQLFFIILIFILGVQVFSRNKITGCLLSIILFQYVTSITLRYYYTQHFGNPLGYNPIDSWLYHSTGVAVQNYSLEELFTYLKCNSFNIDDWGFPLIVYFTYHIFGANIGIDLLLLFNILVITISSFRLYQLAGYFLEKSYALLVTFIWGRCRFCLYHSSRTKRELLFCSLQFQSFILYV